MPDASQNPRGLKIWPSDLNRSDGASGVAMTCEEGRYSPPAVTQNGLRYDSEAPT